MNQGQAILRAQPAQEYGRPNGVLMLGEPHLLPVALILTADLNGLAQWIIEVIDHFPQTLFIHRCKRRELGNDLAVGDEIGVATDG